MPNTATVSSTSVPSLSINPGAVPARFPFPPHARHDPRSGSHATFVPSFDPEPRFSHLRSLGFPLLPDSRSAAEANLIRLPRPLSLGQADIGDSRF
jgi:hypothetical protein